MTVKKEHIIERQGKQFILYTGLLAEAHDQGLQGIRTQLLQVPSAENGKVAICFAEVTMPPPAKGEPPRIFTGIGDADPQNTGKLILLHMIRMAETRAKARALRDATNIGITAFEELSGDDHEESVRKAKDTPRDEIPFGPDPKPSAKTEAVAPHVPDIAALQEEVKAAVVTVAEAQNDEARDVMKRAVTGAAITTPGGWPNYTIYDLNALLAWCQKQLA